MQLLVSLFTLSTQRFFERNFVANDPSCLAAQNLLLCGVYLVYLTDCKPLNLDFCFLRVRLSECTFLLKSVRSSSMSLRRLRTFKRYIFASGVVHSGSLLRMSNRKPFLSYFLQSGNIRFVYRSCIWRGHPPWEIVNGPISCRIVVSTLT